MTAAESSAAWVHTTDLTDRNLVAAAMARWPCLLAGVRLGVLIGWQARGPHAKVVLYGSAGGTWHLLVLKTDVSHVLVPVTAVER